MGVFLVNTQIEHKRRMFRRRREKRWSQPDGAGTTSREKERPIASMAACCCWRGRRGDHTRRVRLFHCSTMYSVVVACPHSLHFTGGGKHWNWAWASMNTLGSFGTATNDFVRSCCCCSMLPLLYNDPGHMHKATKWEMGSNFASPSKKASPLLPRY